jgi:polyhydroxybutyrate depolymerase
MAVRRALFLVFLGCAQPPSVQATAAPPPPSAPRAERCGRGDGARGVVEQVIDVRGRKRRYTLFVPSTTADSALPLVFVLHGHGGDGARARRAFGLETLANGKALFAYPDAVGGWDLDTETSSNRDVALFDEILARAAITYCVDTRRVFVTGFSNGAYMANQLACKRGDRLRGVASHAGGGPYESNGTYDDHGNLRCPGKPVAALVVHGLADTTVLPSEGNKSLAHWSAANGCPAPTLSSGCRAASGCANAVVACGIPALGHQLAKDAAERTWAFFAAL